MYLTAAESLLAVGRLPVAVVNRQETLLLLLVNMSKYRMYTSRGPVGWRAHVSPLPTDSLRYV